LKDIEKEKEEQEIQEALKKPLDYGSPEYLDLIEKIHRNRERYRSEQITKQVLKYKHIKGVYNK
jgi:hypothetical protein